MRWFWILCQTGHLYAPIRNIFDLNFDKIKRYTILKYIK